MRDALQQLNASIADRYRIERELGVGGMATVYLANDLKHDREVALKVLRPEFAATLGADRFLAEIRLTARLQHANIVPLFDSGEADGFLYYVMPYVEGESLRTRLEREKRLDVEATLAIVRPVAQALACAHALGVVHRDIKPENILLSRGQSFVTDFGIARAVSAAGAGRMTATGLAIGTPAYMSPEQALGEATVDARSDVYSLGCVIYELLMGEPPFSGPTAQAQIARRLAGPPPHLTGVPTAVDEVVRRSLATAPQDRFATAIALADALEAAARRPPTTEKSIVVLPFENLSPDPDNAFFADGLTEELIAELSKVRTLRVISRTSAMQFRGARKGVPAIVQELGVHYAVEGTVRRAGQNVRITAQLIDGATDTHLWAEQYTTTLDDVFAIQERLARRIAEGLEVTLTPREKRLLATFPSTDLRAYEAWLRARQEGWKYTKEGVERALSLVEQALAVVGDDALLYAALATFLYQSYDVGIRHDEETLQRAEECASRALEMNPNVSQALLALDLVRYKRGDVQGLIRNAQRAVDLDRNSDALGLLGLVLSEAGRIPEARRFAEEFLARDPLTVTAHLSMCNTEMFNGEAYAAVERIRGAVERLAPDEPFPLFWLGQALGYAGRDEEALAVYWKVAKMKAALFSPCGEMACRALKGDREGVLAVLDSSELRAMAATDTTGSIFLANHLALVGETEEALSWIEHGIDWGFTNHRFLDEHDRFLARLRGSPRFEALLERAREKERALEV